MKCLFPAILLSATVPALCQTAPQHPIKPNQPFQSPRQFQPPRGFIRPPFKAPFTFAPLPRVVVPSQAPMLGEPSLDPQIVRRPPQESFAQQQPRVPLAHNIYPDLKVLPVETARLDPIPADWPRLKVERIPPTWLNAIVTPAQAAAPQAGSEK